MILIVRKLLQLSIVVILMTPFLSLKASAFVCESFGGKRIKFGDVGSAITINNPTRCVEHAVQNYISAMQNVKVQKVNVTLDHGWNEFYNKFSYPTSEDINQDDSVADLRFTIEGSAIQISSNSAFGFTGGTHVNFNKKYDAVTGEYLHTECYISTLTKACDDLPMINVKSLVSNKKIIKWGAYVY